MVFFTKRILSFALSLFIFLILSARFNLASSDLTSSVNTAIPIFSSDAILNCLLSCLCTPRHSLILVSFLLLSLWLSLLFLLLLMPNISTIYTNCENAVSSTTPPSLTFKVSCDPSLLTKYDTASSDDSEAERFLAMTLVHPLTTSGLGLIYLHNIGILANLVTTAFCFYHPSFQCC